MVFKTSREYVGCELEIFSQAQNWNNYISNQLTPFINGTVIEVGAGIGSRTESLASKATRWIAIEPDPKQFLLLNKKVCSNPSMKNVESIHGVLQDLAQDIVADTILYIDVLEHIDRDREELEYAISKLRPNGHLVVLSPAHQWLYTNFDKSIGHYRRYSQIDLLKIGPRSGLVACNKMLDSVGLLASLGNRLLLNESMPTKLQILMWDRLFVSASKILDPLFNFKIGKSILIAWKKSSEGAR